MQTSSLLISKRQTRRGFLRLISCVLVLTFFIQDLSFANPEFFKASNIFFAPQLPKIDIPASIATIEDSYLADSVERIAYRNEKEQRPDYPLSAKRSTLVYLIQDAHTNTSAQRNIAKTIDIILEREEKPLAYSVERVAYSKSKAYTSNSTLSAKRYPLVFLEAGTGNDSLSFLRNHGTAQKRKEVSEKFLRQGYLQGPDYLDLNSNKDFLLWGGRR